MPKFVSFQKEKSQQKQPIRLEATMPQTDTKTDTSNL